MTLEVGDQVMAIPGEEAVLVATWDSYTGAAPDDAWLALTSAAARSSSVLLALGLTLTRREGSGRSSHP
jgi:hypothetical protein